jgi:hypothetical protein
VKKVVLILKNRDYIFFSTYTEGSSLKIVFTTNRFLYHFSINLIPFLYKINPKLKNYCLLCYLIILYLRKLSIVFFFGWQAIGCFPALQTQKIIARHNRFFQLRFKSLPCFSCHFTAFSCRIMIFIKALCIVVNCQ